MRQCDRRLVAGGFGVVRVEACIRSKGIEVILKDLSFDGVLPCVGAYFRDPQVPADQQFHHFFTVGASFNREEALLRCFTEFAQGRREHEFIDGSPEALERLLEADFRRLRTEDNSCDNFLSSFMFGLLPYRDAGFLRDGEVVPFQPGDSAGMFRRWTRTEVLEAYGGRE